MDFELNILLKKKNKIHMQDNEPMLAAMRKLGTWRFSLFFSVMSVQGTSALRAQTKIVENAPLMGTQTCTRQLVLDQHNKSQSHHGLLKLHLVSKLNLRKRKTKSLSGWKLGCRNSEKFTIRWETLTALQVIKHIVCFTTFSQRKIRWFEIKLLLLLSQFPYF